MDKIFKDALKPLVGNEGDYVGIEREGKPPPCLIQALFQIAIYSQYGSSISRKNANIKYLLREILRLMEQIDRDGQEAITGKDVPATGHIAQITRAY